MTKKKECTQTKPLLPPPDEREVGLTAARVAERLQQERDWRAFCRQAAGERRRVERELAALQITLGL